MSSYLADWLRSQRTQLEPSTLLSYEGLVHRYIVPRLGGTPLSDLDVHALNRFYGDLLEHGGRDGRSLSLRTVHYSHSVLHKALSDATRAGRLSFNVADQVTLPRIDPSKDNAVSPLQVWTASELRRFLVYSDARRLHDAWMIAAGTGIRRGELAGLQVADVNVTRRVLHVRRAISVTRGVRRVKRPKSGRSRSLRLDDPTCRVLAHLVDNRDGDPNRYLFEGNDRGPMNPMTLTASFRRAVSHAPVPRIRLHDLRHTHATLMLEAGVPIRVVSERLGHASIRLTLDVYAHVLPAMDADAAERFAAHVWG